MVVDPVAVIKALGDRGAVAAVPILMMYSMFTPADDYNRHVAENRIGTIIDLVADAESTPDGAFHDTLCRTLERELAALCLDSEGHPFCEDRLMLLEKAGC